MLSLPRFALIATLVVLSGPAMAQSGPTPQEQAACRSDAMKLCASFVGRPPEMNACLRANKSQLSDACRKVVEAHGG
ncbi:MAG: cysteine rich repeat-containing protein [Alsobacter sp.]